MASNCRSIPTIASWWVIFYWATCLSSIAAIKQFLVSIANLPLSTYNSPGPWTIVRIWRVRSCSGSFAGLLVSSKKPYYLCPVSLILLYSTFLIGSKDGFLSSLLSVGSSLLGLSTCGILYALLLSFYRIFLHPLKNFPGSKLAAASRWYKFYFELLRLDGG
jgi:hypothetical protein